MILKTSFAVALLLASGLVHAAEPAPSRVLLLGQKPDKHPPGTHEYFPGVKLLGGLLDRVEGVKTRITSADEPWSEGIELLRDADAAVLFVSEGAAWTNDNPRRIDALAQLAERRGGLSVIHWGMGTREAANIAPFLQLFGGCHGGPDRKYQVVDAELRPADTRHPIARGIAPLRVHEEFYYRLKFAPGKPAVEPVLQATIDGAAETVAWAWTRPDGGRSFGFSGLHFHENWRRPEYRRFMVQGVLWTLGREIPADGVAVDLSDTTAAN